MEITYLHDVLNTNFPKGRVFWDLHHYFKAPKGPLEGKKIDLQFDISFFKDLSISYALPSYDATKHGGKVPDIAINILSKSTWRADLSEHVEACRDLSIPVYAIFSPYLVTSKRYAPPFLRVYILQEDGSYEQKELRDVTVDEEGTIDKGSLIDLSDILPFRLGIKKLQQQYMGGKDLFRLIIVDPTELRILPTKREKKLEKAQKKIKEAKKEAESAKKEAKSAKKEAKSAKKEAKSAKKEAKSAKKELEKLRSEIEKYRNKFGSLD
jgi:Uma2 family endonuclease